MDFQYAIKVQNYVLEGIEDISGIIKIDARGRPAFFCNLAEVRIGVAVNNAVSETYSDFPWRSPYSICDLLPRR